MGKFKVPGDARQYTPIEDLIQLEDYVNFSELNGGVGAALLSNGKQFQYKFGFKVSQGIPPTLSDEQFSEWVECLCDSVKAMSQDETLIIIKRVKPDNSKRLHYFSQLAGNAPSRLFEEMVLSAASPSSYFVNLDPHKKQLIARQRYKRREIRIYVTATPSINSSRTRTKSDALIKKAVELAGKVLARFDVETDHDQRSLESVFSDAEDIYANWLNVLAGMRLDLEPMTCAEMVADQWEEFNDGPVPPLPQSVEWDGRQLKSHFHDDTHVSSWLFSDQRTVPKAHRDFVWRTRANGEQHLTGVVTFRNKPAQWKTAKAQLKYLYKKCDALEDYAVVLSINKASEHLVKRNVELMQRQAKDCQQAGEKRNLPTNFSRRLEEQAAEAENAIYEGDVPINMSLCFLVSKGSQKALESACNTLARSFPLPASLEVERDYTATTWLQCFPQLSYTSPLHAPYRRTRGYKASCIPSFMPITSVSSPDEQGLEFITEDEGLPFYLDIAGRHRHMMFEAITRSGKSVLFAQILLLAMCSDIPMVVIDYPKEDGDSTFGPITKLAGEHGGYLNIAKESNNFLQPPDLRGFDEDECQLRMIEIKDFIIDILMIIMFGPKSGVGGREERNVKSIFGNLLSMFYGLPDIKERFDQALDAPIGSPAWRNTPTLKDFSALCTPQTVKHVLDQETLSEEIRLVVNEISLRFNAFMQTTVGRAMSSPTTIPTDAKLLVFAFKGISSNDDAAILMASASAAAMRRTLSFPTSILFMDEAAILSKFPALMYQVAKIAANGAKSGVRLMMALQTPSSIANSEYGDEIIANMSTHVIGRVAVADAKNYCKILSIPAKDIAKNASKAFLPNLPEVYSRWMIVDEGQHTFVRSYAPPLLLAAVANNPDEEAAKSAYLSFYGDPVEALKEFAKELIASAQERRPLRCPEVPSDIEIPVFPNRGDDYAERQSDEYQERYYAEAQAS